MHGGTIKIDGCALDGEIIRQEKDKLASITPFLFEEKVY